MADRVVLVVGIVVLACGLLVIVSFKVFDIGTFNVMVSTAEIVNTLNSQ